MADSQPEQPSTSSEQGETPKPKVRKETHEERRARLEKMNNLLDLQPDWNPYDLFHPITDRYVDKDICYPYHEILERCVRRQAKFGEEEVGECEVQWDQLLKCCRHHRYRSKICHNKYREAVIDLEQSIKDSGRDPDDDIYIWLTRWNTRDRSLWWHFKKLVGLWKDPFDD